MLMRRILVLIVGMFFYASGANITKNCAIGISPIISVAYSLSLITPISMGWCSSLFNISHLFIQKALLKKEYTLSIVVGQMIISVIFSIFVDFTEIVWAFMVPEAYPMKILQLLFGCVVLAFGVYLVVSANFVTMTGEGVCVAIVKKTGIVFGNVKIGFDAACVVLSLAITLIFLHKIDGIREGTLIAAILVGNITKIWARILKRPLDVILKREA